MGVRRRKRPYRHKNIDLYDKRKFNLDADCLLRFRCVEGTGIVPHSTVSHMISTLFNKNFNLQVEEYDIKKFTVQLLALLGILSIFNNDKHVEIGHVFRLHSYAEKIKKNTGENKYVFNLRTVACPKYLTSYLYQLLLDCVDEEELARDNLENILYSYLEEIYEQSGKRLEEI